MSKILCYSFLIVAASIGFVGCGATVDEVPALTAPGTDPTPQQQTNWKEESMKRGGAPEGYEPPKAEDEKK